MNITAQADTHVLTDGTTVARVIAETGWYRASHFTPVRTDHQSFADTSVHNVVAASAHLHDLADGTPIIAIDLDTSGGHRLYVRLFGLDGAALLDALQQAVADRQHKLR